MKWVVQNNLINKIDSEIIFNSCIKNNIECQLLDVVPFSEELPIISNDGLVVFYGGTNFINNIYKSNVWKPGTFFTENFTFKKCVEQYKENMLNNDCEFTSLSKFVTSKHDSNEIFFIRPDKDLKEFAGTTMSFNDIIKWERDIRYIGVTSNNPYFNENTDIIISKPYNIAHEWRLFIINGRVCSYSHYREYFKLKPKFECPIDVINFAEKMCKIFTPSDVFVMDICESGDSLYIIECGCFNSCGFYKSNIEKIIVETTKYIEEKYDRNT